MSGPASRRWVDDDLVYAVANVGLSYQNAPVVSPLIGFRCDVAITSCIFRFCNLASSGYEFCVAIDLVLDPRISRLGLNLHIRLLVGLPFDKC